VRLPARNRAIYKLAVAVWLAAVAMTIGCGGSTASSTSSANPVGSTAQTRTINEVVNIGQYGLHLHCEGSGQPTVVFENGLGGTEIDWSAVRIKLGSKLRACSYDRAGVGMSDPRPSGKASAGQSAEDLARLLAAANEKPPFMLVGWSYGGIVARVYRDRHPDQVAGLVLVDSSSEHQGDDGEALLDGTTAVNLAASVKQTSEASGLGDLPLVVLTAGHHQDDSAKGYAIWMGWQKELAALSTNSLHVVATNSDHPILFEQPEIVVQAINDGVASIDSGKPIEACGERYTSIARRCQT
jgi:thioesterase domain-containing protein